MKTRIKLSACLTGHNRAAAGQVLLVTTSSKVQSFHRHVRTMDRLVKKPIQVFLGVAGTIACAFAMGCSTSSTPMASSLGNNLHLDQNSPALIDAVPTDDSKPKVAVFVSNVECNALVTGRPFELARHVQKAVIEYLVSSRNFAVLESSRSARYVIEVKISSFERGIDKQSDKHSADVLFESSREQDKRKGILELQVAVTDPRSGKLMHGFSAASETEDLTSTKKTGLLGFASVGVNYQRRPDSEVVSEAARKVAIELWATLVNPAEPQLTINKQQ
jgi:hypothetical protein